MASVADFAAGAAGAGALLGVALAVIAFVAYRRTRGSRNLYLGTAFVLLAAQSSLTAYLLQDRADVPVLWLAVPIAQATALVLMYLALLRV